MMKILFITNVEYFKSFGINYFKIEKTSQKYDFLKC